MRILLLFLLVGIVSSCNRGTDNGAGDQLGADNRPAATYARRMLFIGDGEEEPLIVVFDHGVLAGPIEDKRSAGFWQLTDDQWRPLLDMVWTDDPIREPWRLTPYGPFRIIVDDAGEIAVLRGRFEGDPFRLEMISRIGEWAPDDPLHFRVKRAEWSLQADTMTGLLVDMLPSAGGIPEPHSTSSAGGERTEQPPGEAPSGMELVLTDGSEFRLIANISDDGPGQLWVQSVERVEIFPGAELASRVRPEGEGWRIDARGGELTGELLLIGPPLRPNRATAPLTREDAEYLPVSGWVEVRGDRRTVTGVLRRASA